MISNRCARKSLVTNCNSIISKNYLRFLVDSNEIGLYRNFIQYSMQQSLFNTIYILCKKIKLKKSSISLQKEIDDFIF